MSALRVPLRTVIDLRRLDTSKISREEKTTTPRIVRINLVPWTVGVSLFLRLPVHKSVPALFDSRRVGILRNCVLENVRLEKMYRLILKQKTAICSALRAIAKAYDSGEGPVLVHCVHGKDRTGLVVGLVLLLCDVPEVIVIKDYAASGPALLLAKKDGQISKDSPMWLDNRYLVTPAIAMASLLAWLRKKYKAKTSNEAAEAYVRAAGLSGKDIASIRTALLSTMKKSSLPSHHVVDTAATGSPSETCVEATMGVRAASRATKVPDSD